MSLVRFRPEAPYADLAHLVERHLAKVEVAGSSPVIRSKEKDTPCGCLFSLEPPLRGWRVAAKPALAAQDASVKLRLRNFGITLHRPNRAAFFIPLWVSFSLEPSLRGWRVGCRSGILNYHRSAISMPNVCCPHLARYRKAVCAQARTCGVRRKC